ncbi:hypothetical protein [Paenibacillus sp. N3/727]
MNYRYNDDGLMTERRDNSGTSRRYSGEYWDDATDLQYLRAR